MIKWVESRVSLRGYGDLKVIQCNPLIFIIKFLHFLSLKILNFLRPRSVNMLINFFSWLCCKLQTLISYFNSSYISSFRSSGFMCFIYIYIYNLVLSYRYIYYIYTRYIILPTSHSIVYIGDGDLTCTLRLL